jgi:GntR family transcriptional repressor for pyruvate dehydrogenase complex
VANSLLQTVSTSTAVARYLKELILSGELKPGQQIPSERELQGRLSISRLPLREGIKMLEARGILRVQHGKGGFVGHEANPEAVGDALLPLLAQREPGRVSELFEARSFIEAQLSLLAAENSTPEGLTKLREIFAELADCVGDAEAFADKDWEFHRQIATMAGNIFLQVIHEALRPYVRQFLLTSLQTRRARTEAIEQHRPLLEAIASGSPKRAHVTAAEHMRPCLEKLRALAATTKAN